MAEVLVVREYAMMRSSLFGYRDTVLRKTAVRRVGTGPNTRFSPHGKRRHFLSCNLDFLGL